MENKEYIQQLFTRYIQGTASKAEKAELRDIVLDHSNEELEEALEPIAASTSQDPNFRIADWEHTIQYILQQKPESKARVLSMNWKRWVAAASVLIIVAAGLFLTLSKKDKSKPVATTQEQRFKNDIEPGGYKARLTLADGRVIVLDSAIEGVLVKQGETVIVNKDGQLEYSSQSAVGSSEIIFNTLTTAKGETYTTVLADGSKVWLNSASSIRYPVTFIGKERRVEITGEAYFEVAPSNSPQGGGQGKMPFIVSVNGMNVEVLGTHFNVNSYDDESAIRTTLLEGSVKVASSLAPPRNDVIIKPSEQAVLAKNGALTVKDNVNLDKVVAWKNGMFQFESDELPDVMRQLSRWYDIRVINSMNMDQRFTGEIPRRAKLSSVLKAIELTGNVKFIIEGKNITITK